MSKRPTIHAVAALAGVSTATVSKVINQITTGVADETRQRVEAAIRHLEYRPNRIGRGLRTLQRSIVGMAIIDPSPRFLADPFTTNLVAGLTNHLSSHNFGLLLHGVKPHEIENSFLVRESEVDALCLMASGSRRERIGYMRLIEKLGHPFIAFQDLQAPSIKDACFIRQADKSGAMMLAKHLLRRKPRRAAIFSPEVSWPAIEQRVNGFQSVFQANRVHLDLVHCDETRTEAIISEVNQHLDQSGVPDLIIGLNDQIALAAMQALRERGISVPSDVGVSGFNAFSFASFAVPRLTTVRSPAYELGESGARMILDRLRYGVFEKREVVMPVELVPEHSV